MGIDAKQIAALTVDEKLEVLDLLWAELLKNAYDIESPAWHAEALKETEAQLEAGETEFVDWDEAKRQLGITRD